MGGKMEQAVLLPFLIWGGFTIIIFFRNTISGSIRAIILGIFIANALFWYPELKVLKNYASINWMIYLKSSVQYAYSALVWIWPLSLFYAFYTSSDRDAESALTILIIFTAAVWGGYWYFI